MLIEIFPSKLHSVKMVRFTMCLPLMEMNSTIENNFEVPLQCELAAPRYRGRQITHVPIFYFTVFCCIIHHSIYHQNGKQNKAVITQMIGFSQNVIKCLWKMHCNKKYPS